MYHIRDFFAQHVVILRKEKEWDNNRVLSALKYNGAQAYPCTLLLPSLTHFVFSHPVILSNDRVHDWSMREHHR